MASNDNSSFYMVVAVCTFANYFKKLFVPDNTFRRRRLGRDIFINREIYFVLFNIITPEKKRSTITLEQVINVSFPWQEPLE